MGPDAAHEEGNGMIPQQGDPQTEGETTEYRMEHRVGLPPAGGYDSRVGIAGGGDLRLPPPENSHKVYRKYANYGPVSDVETEARDKGGIEVVGTGRSGFGEDVDGGLGGGTDGGGGGYGQDGDRYG